MRFKIATIRTPSGETRQVVMGRETGGGSSATVIKAEIRESILSIDEEAPKTVYTLALIMSDETEVTCVLPEIGTTIDDIITIASTDPTDADKAWEGHLWFNKTAGVMWVYAAAIQSGGIIVPGQLTWYKVGGGDVIAPHIGENGNWYVGETDTGVAAQGEPGKQGDKGDPGDDYVLTDADKKEIAKMIPISVVIATTAEDLASAVAGGGEITLAPGADITVSGMLTLPTGTVIRGNGATIRRAAGFEDVLFFLNEGCRLENFVIEGNRTAMVSPAWDKTIEISTRADCVIDGITINDANEAIVVYENDVIVRGCRLNSCGGNGIHMSGADRTRIEDCVIIGANKNASVMGNSNGCIYWCQESNETVVTGCHCEDGLAGFAGIDGTDNMHLKIIGCTVKDCGNAAFGEYKSTGGPIDVVISGNQFIGCGDFKLTDAGQQVAPGNGLVISGNLFTDTGIGVRGFRNAAITGNTVRGGWIALYRCPYCVVSDNVVDNPGGIGVYSEQSPNLSVSGNSIRCKNYGIYGGECAGIVIFGNIVRQSPHTVSGNCIQLNSCPESAIDNNKLFVYYGNGVMAASNCRTMGNFIVVADSSQIAIRVWGGHTNYVVAQNMSNGTYGIATADSAVIQNNITIESTAFADVAYTLTNITTDGFAKALTGDDFTFTLTAADGYSLPETITVTVGGTAQTSGKGYAYDKTTGRVTVYRVSGAVEITAGGVT